MGQPPEQIQTNPRTSNVVAIGTWETAERPAMMTLQAAPTRIDWRLAAGDGSGARSEGFPDVGNPTVLIPAFRELMLSWLPGCPGVDRIAFGAVLQLPVDSRNEGYQILSAYLPFQLDLSDASDFLFQINRSRRSAVAEVDLNRLSKWSVAAVKTQEIELSAGSIRVATAGERIAARIEVDINTSPEFGGELPHDSIASIFEELVNFGVEIAQEGLAEEYGRAD